MTRTASTFTLTALLAASLQIPGIASADHHTLVDRVKPAGMLVINTATAAPAETAAAPQADMPGGEAAPAAPAAEATSVAVAAEAPANAGQAVYEKTCFVCHMTGAAGAPKLGDSAAWGDRIAKGADALYTSALNGTAKGMPPKGGNAALSEEEIKATVDFMISQVQ